MRITAAQCTHVYCNFRMLVQQQQQGTHTRIDRMNRMCNFVHVLIDCPYSSDCVCEYASVCMEIG